jgi:uncharacterized membrane protein
MSSSQARLRPVAALAFAIGVLYPAIVYFSLDRLPPGVLIALALGALALRAVASRGEDGRLLVSLLALVAVFISAFAIADQMLAIKAYPVLMSLSAAAMFGASLLYPPSLIERIARLRGIIPDGPAQTYMRRLSAIWLAFLIANAAISTAISVWGDMDLWALYNGLLSYLLIGALFFGEMLLRDWIVRRMVSRS